ncbi:Hermansky-Pudlak syndrome 5 protein isoform X1 [Scyliorhinus canicula]|uniref:Hermansky-Pudlak syndrome 5 protein isoform X1 n=1 Tax=Scyliorhinus canicula TaxID=7830 RepID=UPI0018F4A751|nr:Hermansky-Pudlak syndrome 5 protein isoform X1 [Scyliorhinus canicula]
MSLPMIPESCTHVLAELDSLDPLLSALRLDSSRLKCTCLSVCRKWLALGSSAGGLHLIQKEGWKQRVMLTHKEGALTHVACCQHDEDYVAVATSQGHVIVWELHQERRGKPERIYVSSEHKGRQVTALCWDNSALRVFVGDNLGKVSGLKVNSSKQGKAAAFVMFPVQVITTVDSRVVQLDYLDGRLLVSSLTRCYLCDTDREKFWKIGNKERDGEFGACFLPGSKNVGFPQPLIFCARPGSRMWEVNFEGEVLSTHQFKQLLGSPPLPIITHRSELHYNMTSYSPQSISFPRLLCLSENYVLSWTDRGIYVFIPQSVQMLLWSELKDVQNIAVYKNELFCLHADGRVTHLCLLSGERCIERLLRRDMWTLAAQVCCLFQHCITASRTRKLLPVDRLDHLKSQLDATTQSHLVARLEEVLLKLEPFDSACSSRRSSFSSHESFNVLDSGIYRVISRRGSQSDEDSGSLHSHLSEEERLREFTSVQEEEQGEQDNVSHSSLNIEGDRSETLIPFHLPLSFRSASPRVSLQAMKESVSSFVRKTKETISTLHPNTDFRFKPEIKDGELQCEVLVTSTRRQGLEHDLSIDDQPREVNKLQELQLATAEAVVKLQDPLVLFDTFLLKETLQCWLPHLEKTFHFKVKTPAVNDVSSSEEESTVFSHQEEQMIPAFDHREMEVPTVLSHQGGEELAAFSHRKDEEEPAAFLQREEESPSLCFGENEEEPTSLTNHREPEVDSDSIGHQEQREESAPFAHQEQKEGPIVKHGEEMMEEGVTPKGPVVDDEAVSAELHNVPFVTVPFCSIPAGLFKDMTELCTLCFEMGIFESMTQGKFSATELPEIGTAIQACLFLRNYFFLLDLMRVKRSITAGNWSTPLVWQTLILGLQEITQSHPISNTIRDGDLRKVLKLLSGEKQSGNPFLLAHAARMYKKFGEIALRSLVQFHPHILPSDIKELCQQQPAHFLAYIDNLVKSKPEDQRLHLLETILQPKSRKLDWLRLAVSHDAPQRTDTTDIDGNPRPHSHRFTWGYAQLISYFTQLLGDLETKKKMLDICHSYGFWPAYLSLCRQLGCRIEAFTVIIYLDDVSLFDEQNGLMPETLEEWNFVLELVRNHCDITRSPAMQNGDSIVSGDSDCSSGINLENVALLLAKTVGPDRALSVLQDRGLHGNMSERFGRVCDILRIAEKRQRALVQSMLERCDRFLLSQQA